jgi:flagellar biosynthesis protein
MKPEQTEHNADNPAKPTMAVALHYNGQGAPRITAKGVGDVAENIMQIAREHGVPMDEDPALVQALSRVELGREIPRELYLAVAQVLAFAWSIRNNAEHRQNGAG